MAKPLHIPSAIPYPSAVRRGWIPTPNAQSVEWPARQFAPPYYAPGASSVQPYSYMNADNPHVLYSGPDDVVNTARDAGWRPKKLFMAAALVGVGLLLVNVLRNPSTRF